MGKFYIDWDYCLALAETLSDLQTGKLNSQERLHLATELIEVSQPYHRDFALQLQVFLASLCRTLSARSAAAQAFYRANLLQQLYDIQNCLTQYPSLTHYSSRLFDRFWRTLDLLPLQLQISDEADRKKGRESSKLDRAA
ncbi:MAG: DUF29 family protein [Pseudanabaenaceae cyanobacterium SKYGB_i_bin29]|nr:DUF29 family protein [Pseudanabaenaceae cyanobacterium SKYG29]MDW8420760.1 DUF29 family protein [Pseudanabaenaceae cyanobacterium SKYGB_i_bin29]